MAGEELPHGALVGEYRIDKKLAEGGMGAVYSATHPVIGKKAGIKVLLKEHCQKAELVQRFIDEARAVNRIGHEHIVDVFSFGRLEDGRSYFVMEWLNGENLADRINRSKVPFVDAIDVLTQLCEALEATHRNGIVHRDLKPANVFLVATRGARPFVKLLDFGIAKLLLREQRDDAVTGKSNPKFVMGTPDYIAPEQASAQDVQAPADVYALGVIAFELFLGRRPFISTNPVELMVKHVGELPPAPRELWPGIPSALDALLLGMLSKEPSERPTVREVRLRLEEIRAAYTLTVAGSLGAPRASRDRPLLVRRYGSVSALVRALMPELSGGTTWVSSKAEPPAVGTPVFVRFAVEHLGAKLDLGGIVRSTFGDPPTTLIRYDRVPKAQIDAIFSVASAPPSADPTVEEGEIAPPSWESQEARSEADGPAMSAAESSAPTVQVEKVRAIRAPKTLGAKPVPTDRTDRPTSQTKIERAPFGLGARVLGMSILITVLAVLGVTFIALKQARTDRDFYVQDLNLRTSNALAKMLEERFATWRSQLSFIAERGKPEGANEFESIALCVSADSCKTLKGTPFDAAQIKRVFETPGQDNLVLIPDPPSLILASAIDKGAAIGRVNPEGVLEQTEVGKDLSVLLVSDQGQVLGATGPSPGADFSTHQIVLDFLADKNKSTGAREYVTPGGTPMLGAFARARNLGLFVVVPTSVSAEATSVLSEQIRTVALAILALSAILALVFARTMTRRLRKLTDHVTLVADGDFSDPPEVGGSDEVGQLAASFDIMTKALRKRDEDVLKAQSAMSDEESRALQRRMSEWLEHDLAGRLQEIRRVLEEPADPKTGFKDKAETLRMLSEEATHSLKSALQFANIASQRVDFATLVAEVVEVETSRQASRRVVVRYSAPNAVMLPRLEAGESDLREASIALIRGACDLVDPEEEVQIALGTEDAHIVLSVLVPQTKTRESLAVTLLSEVQPIAAAQGGRASLQSDDRSLALGLALPIPTSTKEDAAA